MKFHKFHSLGNDFVILEKKSLSKYDVTPEWVHRISDRNLGIGFDQMLVRGEEKEGKRTRITLDIWNADGSKAQNCINGIRSLVEYEHCIKEKSPDFKVVYHLQNRKVTCYRSKSGKIRIQAGKPVFDWKKLELTRKLSQEDYPFGPENYVSHRVVGLGNLHWILFQSLPPNWFNKDHQMKELQQSEIFPNRANITLAHLSKEKPDTIEVMTYERGTGWTQACGSAACATAVAAIRDNLIQGTEATIVTRHGETKISWQSPRSQIETSGKAHHVYSGELSETMLPEKVSEANIVVLPEGMFATEVATKFPNWILMPLEKVALGKSIAQAKEQGVLPEITFQKGDDIIHVLKDNQALGYLQRYKLSGSDREAWKQSQELLDEFGPFHYIQGEDVFHFTDKEITEETASQSMMAMGSSLFDCLLTENLDILLQELEYRMHCHYAVRSNPVARDTSKAESVQHVAFQEKEIIESWKKHKKKTVVSYQKQAKINRNKRTSQLEILIPKESERNMFIELFYRRENSMEANSRYLVLDVDRENFARIYGKPISRLEKILEISRPNNRKALEKAKHMITLHVQVIHGLQTS